MKFFFTLFLISLIVCCFHHITKEISARQYAFLISELSHKEETLRAAKKYFQDGKITQWEHMCLQLKLAQDKQNYQKKILSEILQNSK